MTPFSGNKRAAALVAGAIVAIGSGLGYFAYLKNGGPAPVAPASATAPAEVAVKDSKPAVAESEAARKEKAMFAGRNAAMSAAGGAPKTITEFFQPVKSEDLAAAVRQSGYSQDDTKVLERLLPEGHLKMARLTISATRNMDLQIKSAGLVQKIRVSGKQDIVIAYAPGSSVEVIRDNADAGDPGFLNLWLARRMFPLHPLAPGGKILLRTPTA